MNRLALVKPNNDFANQIAEYRKEFLACNDSMDGCGSLRRMEDPYEFIKKCKDCESVDTLPEGLVPATQLFLVRAEDNKLLGMIQIRHYLNEYLSKFGGHIGYSIRPCQRRKGYAKKMLSMALLECKNLGINRILITCIDGNLGSERTILANGGVYESTVYDPEEDLHLKRFWINL